MFEYYKTNDSIFTLTSEYVKYKWTKIKGFYRNSNAFLMTNVHTDMPQSMRQLIR